MTEKNNPLIGRSKVLVIDDEYQTRKSLRGLLLAIGCSRIHEASDGSSGIEAIAAVLPDVVLLSWDMQDMQGTEFIRRLRSHRRSMGAGAAMIVLTAHRERSKVLEAMRHGIHEFLLKPVSRAALEARMLSVLSQHAPQAVSDHEGGPESRKLAS